MLNLPVNHMQVAFHHTGGSVTGEMVNTLAFSLTDDVLDTPGEFLALVSQLWSDQVHTNHVAQIVYTHASAIYNDPIFGKVAYDSDLGNGAGGRGATAMMPLSVALVIQKTTGFAGRKFRGRMFFGGFPTSWMGTTNPNMIQDALVTSVNVQWATFHTGILARGARPVLLHPLGGASPTGITSFDVHPLVATLRKRIR